MTIYDDLMKCKGYKKHTGTYGIEIETESFEEYMVPGFKYWRHDEDHSLRNFGIEYMLKSPLVYPVEVEDALGEFEEKTKGIEFDRKSNSTSVHVHMNMLHEKWLTLATIFTTYALYENLLIRWSGPTRRSNLFCLPICDAESQYTDMIQVLKYVKNAQVQNIWNFDEKSNKYAAMNFVPLTIHGSIEFRSFRGDPSKEAILEWIKILDSILVFARKHTPTDVINLYRKDKDDLLCKVFGKENAIKLYKEAEEQGDNPDELISRNFWYAASIALWNKDWSDFGVFEAPKPKEGKAFTQFCMDTFGSPPELLTKEELDMATIMFKNNGGIKNNLDPLLKVGWQNAMVQNAMAQPPMAQQEVFEYLPDPFQEHEDE